MQQSMKTIGGSSVLQMFDHILTLDREVFWKYGNVTCAAFSLRDIDTVSNIKKQKFTLANAAI